VNDPPPAEILGRLRPIPTYRDHPATTACDIAGVSLSGMPSSLKVVGSAVPLLLLFLSSECQGCRDLWEGIEQLGTSIPDGVRVVVLTHGPEREDAQVVTTLAPTGTEVVMSSQAYADYRVAGPPFLVVVAGDVVRTEGVAWGIHETAQAVRAALAG
jgi:hypothetical protein